MIRAGEIRRWHPKYHIEGGVHEDIEHPWYGKAVKVLTVQENAAGRMCKIRPAQRPLVNNPEAFDFWADEEELDTTD